MFLKYITVKSGNTLAGFTHIALNVDYYTGELDARTGEIKGRGYYLRAKPVILRRNTGNTLNGYSVIPTDYTEERKLLVSISQPHPKAAKRAAELAHRAAAIVCSKIAKKYKVKLADEY